jgi:hypothetical protein
MIYNIQMKSPESETHYDVTVQTSYLPNNTINTVKTPNSDNSKSTRNYDPFYACLMM